MNKTLDSFIYDLQGFKETSYINRKIYRLWRGMIERCYNPKTFERRPSYKWCYICDRWIYFSNFVEDIKNITNYDKWFSSHINKDNEKWSIDKDILQSSVITKIYSPNTCLFVTVSQNSSECMNRNRSLNKCVNHDMSKFKQPCLAIDIKDTSKFYYFDSLNDMYDTLGISSRSSGKVFRGSRLYANGYYLYKIIDGIVQIPEYKPEYIKKLKYPKVTIVGYHDSLSYPRYFIDARQTSRELNLSLDSIYRVLKGEYKHTHGWFFERI